MNTGSIKEGLEGLSKIDGFSNLLYTAAYWIGVIFVLVFVAYIIATINLKIMDKKRGIDSKDKDNYLDD